MKVRRCPMVFVSSSEVSAHVALHLGVILLAILIIAAAISIARAEIPGLTWQDPEIVASGVLEIPSNPGHAAAHTPRWNPWGDRQEWHVVYAISGHVFHQWRTETGWQPPEQVTGEGAVARDPKLTFHSNVLHVVWEDERTGHPEIWSRYYDGSEWSDEVCVTCDEPSSSAPVVAGDNDDAFLVWQEGPDGSSQIHGSFWESGVGWGAAEAISESPAAAFEPSVTVDDWNFYIVWADTRHGDSEIYQRVTNNGGFLSDEERITDMAGSCRRPDAHVETVGGDLIEEQSLICFENDQTGPPEIWTTCYTLAGASEPQRISSADGRPSIRPNITAFRYRESSNDFGFMNGRWFVTWTDQPVSGPATNHILHFRFCPEEPLGDDILSEAGLSTSTLGAIGAYWSSPDGEILALWVEDKGRQPALHSRRGNMLGCHEVEITAPNAAVLGPEGFPADTLTAWNTCGEGSPIEGDIEMDFSDVDNQLTWDKTQQHPIVGPVPIDSEGRAIFEIRGGGCATSGLVMARLLGVTVATWIGARSPDIDGNCAVTFDDVVYVHTQLGTDDFCADLDGSGLVDEVDAAIVEAAYGDYCTQASSADDPDLAGDLPGNTMRVRVAPNPFVRESSIALELPASGPAMVRVVDVRGRIVKDFGTVTIHEGRGALNWDARDRSGRRVASGVYFIHAEFQGRAIQRSVLVLR